MAGPEALGTSAASERVLSYLRDRILAGDYAPDERIRQEEIAEQIETSRPLVREALRLLEAEGLVNLEPNKGGRVASLEPHEFDALYRIRERLEPMAIAESVPNLRRSDIDRLHKIQARIEADPELGEFVTLDRELHLLSYSGCTIEQLNTIVGRLWNSTQHYRRAFIAHLGMQRRWMVNVEHRLLIDSIERGDATEAAMIIEVHIRRTRVQLSEHPEVFDATRNLPPTGSPLLEG
jgi:DNA-binding GntR family transcriptional regulator